MRDELIKLVSECISELAQEEGLELAEGVTEQTRLFGDGGILDSMALVAAVVAVEQLVDDRFGAVVSLADEKALSMRKSPYTSVGSLADFAMEQIQAKG